MPLSVHLDEKLTPMKRASGDHRWQNDRIFGAVSQSQKMHIQTLVSEEMFLYQIHIWFAIILGSPLYKDINNGVKHKVVQIPISLKKNFCFKYCSILMEFKMSF